MPKYSQQRLIGMAGILVVAKIQGDPRYGQFLDRVAVTSGMLPVEVQRKVSRILVEAGNFGDINYSLAISGITQRSGWTAAQIEQEIEDMSR